MKRNCPTTISGWKQEEDATGMGSEVQKPPKRNKYHEQRPNDVLAVYQPLSQLLNPKGSVEKEDDGRESTSHLLLLPLEIRRIIWKLVLLSPEESPIPRRNNGPLHGLRHRYGQNTRFWSATTLKNADTDIAGWRGKFSRFHEVMPVKNHDFSRLVRVSKAIASQVVEAFFGETHWIFENRLNVHLFLDAIGDKRQYLKSISLCLLKSQAPYSNEVKTKYKSWKLGNSSPGPSLLVTIDRLQNDCPNLEYLELRPQWITGTYPSEDKKQMRNKPYTEWAWVGALTGLPLKKGFTFCHPNGKGRDKLLLPAEEGGPDNF